MKRSSLVNDGNNFRSSVKTFEITFVVNVLLVKTMEWELCHNSVTTQALHYMFISLLYFVADCRAPYEGLKESTVGLPALFISTFPCQSV